MYFGEIKKRNIITFLFLVIFSIFLRKKRTKRKNICNIVYL
nr:MAG TPA: Interleukin-13, Interleukin-13 receptor subunit alpha-2, receptor, decoy, decoy receptor [Bacteriophage sp.]